jgi:hypothetical protein
MNLRYSVDLSPAAIGIGIVDCEISRTLQGKSLHVPSLRENSGYDRIASFWSPSIENSVLTKIML